MNTSSPFTPESLSLSHPRPQGLPLPYCRPITSSAFVPYVLVILQCVLLHPAFAQSRLARSIRVGLTPLNVVWAFRFPFQYCFWPLESFGQYNMCIGCFALYTSLKCLEWGTASAPYYKRPLKVVDGVPRWEKIMDTEDSYKKTQEDEPCTAFKLITWTLLQMTSTRGLQFTWGPAMVANTLSTSHLILRYLRLSVVRTCALALIVLTRDSPLGTPSSGLLSIGVPNFLGLRLLAELVYAASFAVWLSCSMDTSFTLVTLLATGFHKLSIYFHFPEPILELCDPVYYPPMFNSPYKVTSVADLWGRAWHTFLQRTFVCTGGKPVIWITTKLGASRRMQRIAGLFGIFTASAFVHEYMMFVAAQVPHSNPHTLNSFPGSGAFFIIQPFAMLIEPYIIPLIPKSLGGGRLWVWAFSGLASYPFRVQYLAKDRMVAHFPPLSQWSWNYIISPVK